MESSGCGEMKTHIDKPRLPKATSSTTISTTVSSSSLAFFLHDPFQLFSFSQLQGFVLENFLCSHFKLSWLTFLYMCKTNISCTLINISENIIINNLSNGYILLY